VKLLQTEHDPMWARPLQIEQTYQHLQRLQPEVVSAYHSAEHIGWYWGPVLVVEKKVEGRRHWHSLNLFSWVVAAVS